MKFFRGFFFPAVITMAVFAVVAYVSYRGNKDYDIHHLNDLSMNNNVFPHSTLPYQHSR